MKIKEINDKEIWEKFLLDCQEKTFLQSWNWGEFSKAMGEKIWRLGIFDSDVMLAVVLVEKKITKRGIFLLVPHGPVPAKVAATETNEILKILTEKLREIAAQERVSFIRINPILERNEGNIEIFKKLGFRDAPIQMHPEASWKLNISRPEENLLADMRKTTRYLIRQAQKNENIKVSQSNDFKDVELFSQFHGQISQRQRFVPFSLEYLQKEFSAFIKDDAVRLFFGHYNNEIAAGSFVIFWSGIGFYHHAISVPKYAKFSTPYLLQWEAIKEAKRRECQLYDFWGFVDPILQPNHPWAGPTLFKMGFGGKASQYVKTQDLPLAKKYWLTWVFEKIRRMRRRL